MRRKDSRADSTASVSGRRHLVRTSLAVAVVAMLAVLVTAVAHPMLPQRVQASSSPSNPPMADRVELVSQAQAVSVDGVQRTYRSIAPLHVTSPLPLLVVLHGRGESGSVVASRTGFLGLVEQRRAILVAPDGEHRSWNAGHGCCGVAGSRGVPDVPFVAATVADAARRWPVDAGRVYLVGYSNGGKLAYSEVCAHPTLFAAVATYGAVPLSPCNPGTAAVPFLLAAGSADRVLPFGGKPGGNPPIPSVPQALGWLRAQDGCLAGPRTGRDGSAVVQKWSGCAGTTEVESVVYPGQGHAWPAAGLSGGSPAAATVMWAFLSRHGEPAAR
ncbi:MAG TPA: PHB depolymerase family esterase [Mycobacterium sp.]|nr:PHB depolymerase family esterase [Mycobacterium sp.]